jgi:hypothetical protein
LDDRCFFGFTALSFEWGTSESDKESGEDFEEDEDEDEDEEDDDDDEDEDEDDEVVESERFLFLSTTRYL